MPRARAHMLYAERKSLLSGLHHVWRSPGMSRRQAHVSLVCPAIIYDTPCNRPYKDHHKCRFCEVILHSEPHHFPGTNDQILSIPGDVTLCEDCHTLYILGERNMYLTEVSTRLVCMLENL